MTLPGPSGGWLLGVAPAFKREALTSLLDGHRRYGDVVAYRFGPRRGRLGRLAVAVHHPDDVHRVFTGHEHVFNRHTVVFSVLTEVFGSGLLTTEGEVWKRQRRTLQPLFTPRHVTGYAQLMAAEADRVVRDIGAEVDLHELMQRYTLRVVGRALFGEDVDDIVPVLHDLVPRISDLTRARTMQPARFPLGWPTPRNVRLSGLRRGQYALVDGILAKRRRGAPRDDLVGRLAAARDPDTGQPLSEQEIRDQVLIFLLAGHETTAGALTFTVHQLGLYPEAQDRVAGDEGYAKAALREGMRLYPPAYATERLAAVDTELGGYPVPRGTVIIISPYVTHRHPGFWPDPARYRPERFLGDQKDRHRYAYFPFGGGARSCIGEHFALLEATILLRALLTRYRVTSLDPEPRVLPLVTLRPADPVRAAVSPR